MTVWWSQIHLFALSSNILWLYRIPSFSVHCEFVQPMCLHSLKEVFIAFKVNRRTPSWNGFGACFKGKTPLSWHIPTTVGKYKTTWKKEKLLLKKLCWDTPKAANLSGYLSHCKLDWSWSWNVISSKASFFRSQCPQSPEGRGCNLLIPACSGLSNSMACMVQVWSIHQCTHWPLAVCGWQTALWSFRWWSWETMFLASTGIWLGAMWWRLLADRIVGIYSVS